MRSISRADKLWRSFGVGMEHKPRQRLAADWGDCGAPITRLNTAGGNPEPPTGGEA
ncbi:MAG: hypothetical protein LBD44_03380 [Spirochaetaceae bacterium]|nr:hypothetical protein [Spirochaetaceae bacterium]